MHIVFFFTLLLHMIVLILCLDEKSWHVMFSSFWSVELEVWMEVDLVYYSCCYTYLIKYYFVPSYSFGALPASFFCRPLFTFHFPPFQPTSWYALRLTICTSCHFHFLTESPHHHFLSWWIFLQMAYSLRVFGIGTHAVDISLALGIRCRFECSFLFSAHAGF